MILNEWTTTPNTDTITVNNRPQIFKSCGQLRWVHPWELSRIPSQANQVRGGEDMEVATNKGIATNELGLRCPSWHRLPQTLIERPRSPRWFLSQVTSRADC